MSRETPQEILARFIKMYMKEGERAAVEMAAPWLGAHPGVMEGMEDPDSAALLWAYYGWLGEEDTAWEWREKAEESGSPLMEQMLYDEAEEELEEDDWNEADEDDWEQEFDAYDDETEAGG